MENPARQRISALFLHKYTFLYSHVVALSNIYLFPPTTALHMHSLRSVSAESTEPDCRFPFWTTLDPETKRGESCSECLGYSAWQLEFLWRLRENVERESTRLASTGKDIKTLALLFKGAGYWYLPWTSVDIQLKMPWIGEKWFFAHNSSQAASGFPGLARHGFFLVKYFKANCQLHFSSEFFVFLSKSPFPSEVFQWKMFVWCYLLWCLETKKEWGKKERCFLLNSTCSDGVSFLLLNPILLLVVLHLLVTLILTINSLPNTRKMGTFENNIFPVRRHRLATVRESFKDTKRDQRTSKNKLKGIVVFIN